MVESHGLVVFVMRDASRLGYQLRMNIGGRYLDQLRLAAAMLAERAATTADAIDSASSPPPSGVSPLPQRRPEGSVGGLL